MTSDASPPRSRPEPDVKPEKAPVIIDAAVVAPGEPPIPPELSRAAPEEPAGFQEPTPVAPEPAPVPPAAPERRPANKLLTSLVACGVAGLTIVAGYFWQQNKLASESQVALRGDIGSLAARLETSEKKSADLTRSLERAVAIENRVLALEKKPAPRDEAALSALAALEKRLAEAEVAAQGAVAAARAASSASETRFNALAPKISALESANREQATPGEPPASPPPAAPAIDPAVLAALELRLAALESAPRSPAPQAEAPQARPAAPAFDPSPLLGRIDALEKSLAAPKIEARATETPVARTPREADNAASLAVVAQAILTAIERGASFAPEVAAAENLGADAAKVAVLKPLATAGAPSAAKLAAAFRTVSRATLDAAAPPVPANPGVLDKIGSAAASLVRVRPVGEATGEDAPALVARIEAALDRGVAREALALWDKLPPPARKASESFAAGARQRVGAEAAARDIFASAIAELARKRSNP